MEKLHLALKAGQIVVVERVITALTRSVDVLTLYLVITDPVWGFVNALIWGGVLNYILSAIIVSGEYYLVTRFGKGVTGVYGGADSLLAEFEGSTSLTARAIRTICERRGYVFFIGSWFYLDPDYVTLILARRGNSLRHLLLTITLPSTVLATLVWVPIWWVAVYIFNVSTDTLL